jgi:hypothetical protein
LSDEAISVVKAAGRDKLAVICVILLGFTYASVSLAALAITEAYVAVEENRGKGANEAADKALALKKLMTRLGSAQSAAQFSALGLLGFTGLSNLDLAPHVRPYVSQGFAISDLTSGIADFVSVFRKGGTVTAAGAATLVSGSFRIAGGAWTTVDNFYKIYSWDKKATLFSPRLAPLNINTYTAAGAAALYFIAGCISASS